MGSTFFSRPLRKLALSSTGFLAPVCIRNANDEGIRSRAVSVPGDTVLVSKPPLVG